MSFINKYDIMKKAATATLLMLPALTILAKGGGVAPETKAETNWLEMLMIFVAIILLLVIWGLGQALLTFSRQLLQKRKSEGVLSSAILLVSLLSISDVARAQVADAAPTVLTLPNYGGLTALEFYLLSTVIALEVVVIFFLAFMARRTYRELTGVTEKSIAASAIPTTKLADWWKKMDEKIFTRAVPVEQEADIMLDHDYDGIRELDNALPPWWKWGFYITIVVAVIYFFNYQVLGTGKSQEQEYAAEMAEGKLQEEQYKARTKDLVDENNVTMSDADGIAAGKALYMQSCVACHAADGGGGIGPNLTDVNWIHGGSMNDIYKTIKLGYPEKGMQSWQTVYSPMQMKHLSSFVHSLRGSKPANPKEPQGVAYVENAASSLASANVSKTNPPN
jgi:cytochrome c oxidase cbb3-type subunit 3